MGCCYSWCKNTDDSQEGISSERTHLLVDPVRNEPTPLRPARSVQPPRKSDEQSALSRILQETATNVIDVGALGSHALEAHEYNERFTVYQTRLCGGGGGGSAGNGVPPPHRLLKDVSQAEKNNILSQDPISQEDKDLITNIARKAAAAMSDLKVEHREDLVVPFRIVI